MVNDMGKVLFILHSGNSHREILLNTPQVAHVSSQDPTHISLVTQHTRKAAEKEAIISPYGTCLHRGTGGTRMTTLW